MEYCRRGVARLYEFTVANKDCVGAFVNTLITSILGLNARPCFPWPGAEPCAGILSSPRGTTCIEGGAVVITVG